MNFPTRHPLNQSLRAAAAIGDADLVVGLEVADFWATVNALRDQLRRSTRPTTKPDAKMITITTGDLYVRANYQDFRRMQPVDLAIAADGEATLPALIEAVKRLATAIASGCSRSAARLAEASAPRPTRARGGVLRVGRQSVTQHALGRNLGPDQNEDWALV